MQMRKPRLVLVALDLISHVNLSLSESTSHNICDFGLISGNFWAEHCHCPVSCKLVAVSAKARYFLQSRGIGVRLSGLLLLAVRSRSHDMDRRHVTRDPLRDIEQTYLQSASSRTDFHTHYWYLFYLTIATLQITYIDVRCQGLVVFILSAKQQ